MNSGSTGTVTMTGSASTWGTTYSFFVGDDGTGTLTIADGGSVATPHNIYVGNGTGSTGTVTVTGAGSTLDASTGNFFIGGGAGNGTLIIENGASAGEDLIGINSGETGTVIVTGAGSTLTDAALYGPDNGDLYIGNGTVGSGTLTIADGGTVEMNPTDYAQIQSGGCAWTPSAAWRR